MLYPLSYEGGACAGLAADPHMGVLRLRQFTTQG